MEKYVYSFNEGSRAMTDLLGVKGAGLAEMTRLGLPVPFGFTITTKACMRYLDEGCKLSLDVEEQIREKIKELEEVSGKEFGDEENPLLLAVRTGAPIPMPGMTAGELYIGADEHPLQELFSKVEEAFKFWDSPEMRAYRKRNKISESIGLAVNVQLMAFEQDDEWLVADVFSRNPYTGDNQIYGEYSVKTSADGVVKTIVKKYPAEALQNERPEIYEKALGISKFLEKHYADMQDITIAVSKDELYMLQTRSGRRTPEAAAKIAADMVHEGIIDKKTALKRLEPSEMREMHYEEYEELVKWADEIRTLKVRARVDEPADIKKAAFYGCNGIGYLDITKFTDIKECFSLSGDAHVVIYLGGSHIYADDIFDEAQMKVLNKYMSRKGCRWAVKYPEIVRNEVKAIITAAMDVLEESGIEIVPEITVPYVINAAEFIYVKQIITAAAEDCFKTRGSKIRYLIGCSVETPQAALNADELAEYADFFSFGGGDITELSFGISRKDNKGISEYIEAGILKNDPFEVLDMQGAGRLIETAVKLGKEKNGGLKLGICGTQAGKPGTVAFAHKLGMNYVTCKPEELAIAKLAAARAELAAAE